METKQLIIIVLAIIVAGCIIAGACAYSIMSANNDSDITNATNSTNSTNLTANNTTAEVIENSQSSQSNNHAQSSSNYNSEYEREINEKFGNGYGTDEFYASHGFQKDDQGRWTDQNGNPAA